MKHEISTEWLARDAQAVGRTLCVHPVAEPGDDAAVIRDEKEWASVCRPAEGVAGPGEPPIRPPSPDARTLRPPGSIWSLFRDWDLTVLGNRLGRGAGFAIASSKNRGSGHGRLV